MRPEDVSVLISELTPGLRKAIEHDDLARPSAHLTLPQRMLSRASSEPDSVAIRQKYRGYYHDWSWKKLALEVAKLESALRELDFRRGDRLVLIGDTRIELFLIEMAAMASGGIAASLYPSHSAAEIQTLLKDLEPAIVVADKQEQLDKTIAALPAVSSIRSIILLDTKTKFMYPQSNVLDYKHIHDSGARAFAANPQFFFESVNSGRADDAAMILYADFSSGNPKGTVQSHRSYHASLRALVQLCPTLVTKVHRTVAVVPMAHAIGKMTAYLPLVSRLVAHFGEDVENLRSTINEVAPTFIVFPPRIFQKLASGLSSDLRNTTGLKRLAYRAAMSVARQVQRGNSARLLSRVAYIFARLLVLQPLLDKIGLSRVEYAAVGGAAAPQDVVSLWRQWGLNLHEIYLQTECGIVLAQQGVDRRIGSFRAPLPKEFAELRVSETSELLVRALSLAVGHWHDGRILGRKRGEWHRTGDLVDVSHGDFRLVGRETLFATLINGVRINQQRIANLLKGSSFISEAIVVGHGRNAVSALLELDFDVTSQWARDQDLSYTSYANLVKNEEVQKKIKDEIELVNRRLDERERIRGFRAIPFELDPELGVITCSRGIVFSKVEETFQNLIADIYQEIETRSAEDAENGE